MTKLWTCTVCGKQGPWRNGWMYYGSLIHAGTCMDDLPVACSPACQEVVAEKLRTKEWQIPKLSKNGPYIRVIKGRKGY